MHKFSSFHNRYCLVHVVAPLLQRLQNHLERALDVGDTVASERTAGIAIDTWAHPAGGTLSLWDHGGGESTAALMALGVAAPAVGTGAVFVVVVPLTLPRAAQRAALRQWAATVRAVTPQVRSLLHCDESIVTCIMQEDESIAVSISLEDHVFEMPLTLPRAVQRVALRR